MKNILLLAFILVSACATQERAPVVMGSAGKTSSEQTAPVASPFAPPTNSYARYKLHEVLFSDSLASIAKRYNVSPHDIISLNNLTKPYYLEPGEVLKIPVSASNPQDGFLKLPENKAPMTENSGVATSKNIVKILPPLQTEQLQDYD